MALLWALILCKMKELVRLSPISGLKLKSKRHSCILLVILVFPSSLFYNNFNTIFFSTIWFFRTETRPFFSTFWEDIMKLKS